MTTHSDKVKHRAKKHGRFRHVDNPVLGPSPLGVCGQVAPRVGKRSPCRAEDRTAPRAWFPLPRGRRKKAKSIVRYANIEQMDEPLAYIFYNGEHWFLLDQIVRTLNPYIENENSETGKFCCARGCKDMLLTLDTFRRIGGKDEIRLSSCYDTYVLDGTAEIMSKQRIGKEHLHPECVPLAMSVLMSGENVQVRLRQYDDKAPEKLILVLLIDFQSIHALCRMAQGVHHLAFSFLLAFSNLCTNRGEARSALTKRDKERIAAKQEWKCGMCHELFDASARYEVDHGIPLSHGGRNAPSNLWAVCVTCHKQMTDDEMSYPLKPL